MSSELLVFIVCIVLVIASFINLLIKYSKKKNLLKPILSVAVCFFLCYLSYGLFVDSCEMNKNTVPVKKTVDIKKQAESRGSSRERTLKNRLAYLADIPEIEWFEIESNYVYLGFNKRPDDLYAVVPAAALHGNKAIDFGVHVWAVGSA